MPISSFRALCAVLAHSSTARSMHQSWAPSRSIAVPSSTSSISVTWRTFSALSMSAWLASGVALGGPCPGIVLGQLGGRQDVGRAMYRPVYRPTLNVNGRK